MTRLQRLLIALALVAACLGCREKPEIVFIQARDSLKSKDVEGFLDLCTPRTKRFLERSEEVAKKSGRSFKVLRDASPSARLLPKGDVSDVVAQGHRCIVVVRKGRRTSQVPMLLVQGQWRIDLLEMDTFLAAVTPLE